MDSKNSSTAPLKTEAKALRKYLTEQGIELGHSKCLEAVARMRGFKNWDTVAGTLRTQTQTQTRSPRPPEKKPYAVLVSRAEWDAAGDPANYDVFNYFGRSILNEEEMRVFGAPGAVDVHHALCMGEEVPPGLAARVLAVCYSDEEFKAAWLRLEQAFHLMEETRRVALRSIFHGDVVSQPDLVPDTVSLPVTRAADIEKDTRPCAEARGLCDAAKICLERGQPERAVWRLFDAAIHVAEGLEEIEVTSGLGKTRGWKMTKAGALEPLTVGAGRGAHARGTARGDR